MKIVIDGSLFKKCKHCSLQGNNYKCDKDNAAFWDSIPCYISDEKQTTFTKCPDYEIGEERPDEC
jgi:hypothetical protein